MALTARVALQRGFFNLLANWELAAVVWVQTLLMAVFMGLGMLPLLWLAGVRNLASALAMDAAAWQRWSTAATERFLASQGPSLTSVGIALGASLVIWTIGFILYCYLQGGILAILVAADRQCPPGSARDRELFRVFSLQGIFGWGRRYVWRFFWLFNLLLALYLVWILLLACLIGMAVFAAQRWGGMAAFGLGCGGALPLLFGLLVLGLAANLAQVALPVAEATVRGSLLRAFQVLGRRLGAVLLLTVLWILATITISIVVAITSFSLSLLVGPGQALGVALQVGTTLVEWLIGSMLAVALMASMAALVHQRRDVGP